MLYSKKESLEDKIVRYLLIKEQTVKSLKKELKIEKISVTIQALYKILRSLIDQEIVIKQGFTYFIMEEWKNNILYILNISNNKFELNEGEKVTLELTSLIHLEQQWKNIILPLERIYPKYPIFFYSYHYIWIYLSESRKKSELNYFSSFIKNKNHAFSLIGSSNNYDVEVKKKLQNEFVHWAVGTEYFLKTDYPTIFGDYIITTRLSKQLVYEIEECYKKSINLTDFEIKIQKIGIEKKNVKLVIEHNVSKAKKLRKKLSKEFFVPKDLIKEFDLY